MPKGTFTERKSAMSTLYQHLLKPLFFALDAETAHHLVFAAAGAVQRMPGGKTLASALFAAKNTSPVKTACGLEFPNRAGVAAGFDKNGKLPDLLFAAGFGHVEIGSITANPSTGNPKPRLFRLPEDEALINRMGLNNDGAAVICERLAGRQFSGVLGINVAKTHDPAILGDAAIRDYCYSVEKAIPVAGYITINISCPNTTEGKTFEDESALKELLSAISAIEGYKTKPFLVKLSADINETLLENLVEISLAAGIAGFVAVNTSVSRDGLKTNASRLADIGRGGLSGKPLQTRAIKITQMVRSFAGDNALLISAGGIDSDDEAKRRIDAGADLVQAYTALIYKGPGLGGSIAGSLATYSTRRNRS